MIYPSALDLLDVQKATCVFICRQMPTQRPPGGELLVDEPLLGVPPHQFVRPSRVFTALPMPEGYMPGPGFERGKHMDAAACRLPPAMSDEERDLARRVERAKAGPQVISRMPEGCRLSDSFAGTVQTSQTAAGMGAGAQCCPAEVGARQGEDEAGGRDG